MDNYKDLDERDIYNKGRRDAYQDVITGTQEMVTDLRLPRTARIMAASIRDAIKKRLEDYVTTSPDTGRQEG